MAGRSCSLHTSAVSSSKFMIFRSRPASLLKTACEESKFGIRSPTGHTGSTVQSCAVLSLFPGGQCGEEALELFDFFCRSILPSRVFGNHGVQMATENAFGRRQHILGVEGRNDAEHGNQFV